MIIDEWDAILREMGSDDYISTSYVDLLRRLFKGLGSDFVFAGAYLTGILPIKKYNTESALNNFREYSMITPGRLASSLGFIQMNFDGLKDDIIRMLSGESIPVITTKFQNDMNVINSRNDVLTVLIHLGYLAYNRDTNRCYIPNKEVADEMNNAVQSTEWSQLAKTLENSQHLLDATIAGNENAVAKAIDLAHDENTSILAYNDENSLACVITVAYIWARNEYVIHRE